MVSIGIIEVFIHFANLSLVLQLVKVIFPPGVVEFLTSDVTHVMLE